MTKVSFLIPAFLPVILSMTLKSQGPGQEKTGQGPYGIPSTPVIEGATGIPDRKTVNSLGMELIRIEPGSFLMGDVRGEYDEVAIPSEKPSGYPGNAQGQSPGMSGQTGELPLQPVTLTKPFYMGATPVTNAQYEQFNPDHKLLRGKRDLSSGDDEAAIFINWYEAVAFTQWLSLKEGKPYRLPTEAEWEYACRAGTRTPFVTGDSLPAIYHLNQKDDWYPHPADLTVGKSPSNPWGLYNMHGLVEEWCLDWYGPYSAGALTDPAGYVAGDSRVTRGGSHNTDPGYLRSANRSGMIPEDKNHFTGFRVVQAEMPVTPPLPVSCQPVWSREVVQEEADWEMKIPADEPYFEGPVSFQNVPPDSNGPLYSKHNHCPDITPLPNGDLFATWYSTNTERGRELTVVAARLRKDSARWDPPDLFYKIPDRNMHATSIWWDRQTQRIYHFQGVGVGYGWGDLALFMRTSDDNGKTWSRPHWLNHEHGRRNMPIAGIIRTSDNVIVVPCDAVTGGNGGTAIHISKDDGITWTDPGAGTPQPLFEEGGSGGTIAGIHAGVAELSGGRLMALGRGDNINGKMPVSISSDLGRTWYYSASPFPPVSSGQRLVFMRLLEGPLLVVSFTGPHDNDQGMMFKDGQGNAFRGYGLFAALSYDEGKSWPVMKLITPGTGEYDGGAHTRIFKTSDTQAEPRGYLAATQTPDNIIHLISSKLHYKFNLSWLTR